MKDNQAWKAKKNQYKILKNGLAKEKAAASFDKVKNHFWKVIISFADYDWFFKWHKLSKKAPKFLYKTYMEILIVRNVS